MNDSITRTENNEEQQRVFLGCDAHRKYSVFVAVDEKGKASAPVRVEHDRKQFRMFLRRLQPGTDVAVEATGSWYWLADELEAAGLVTHLAQTTGTRNMPRSTLLRVPGKQGNRGRFDEHTRFVWERMS